MKKLLVLSLAVALVIAFTLPASALESVFGGYWRTRFVTQQNFQGDSDLGRDTADALGAPGDLSQVDTRTRLYYTAVLNDNLKFVNQFEFDAVWGGQGTYGDFGGDAVAFEIRHSYIDATVGAFRATVGAQPLDFSRGFIFSDTASGMVLSTKLGDVLIPFAWFKANEGGTDWNSTDADIFALYPVFKFGDNWSLNPFLIYGYSSEGDQAGVGVRGQLSTYGANGIAAPDDGAGVYWIGANVDATLGAFNLWFSGAYQGGKLKYDAADDIDVAAFFVAGGLSVPLGPANLHGQAFYASGDDDDTDDDAEAFFGVGGGGAGWTYYWAEIMGNGIFDEQISVGSTTDISNLWAASIGATIKPMEKLSLTGDIWYAALVEDDFTTGETNLGVEIDLKATYQLTEGLNLDLVAAYLFADDATSVAGSNEDDPYELGARLSISF
jgi:hypothetical protein